MSASTAATAHASAPARVAVPTDPSTPAPTDPRLPSRVGVVPPLRELCRLFGRTTLADRQAWLLPVAAMAVSSALALVVAGGVHFFFTVPGQLGGLYRTLAVVALVLLLVPLATLAAAAARLSATRRDTRLSAMRLLGARAVTLRLLTLVETGATALAGCLIGLVGYLVLLPAVGMLHFVGGPIGVARLWPGLLVVAGLVLGLVVLSLVSAVIGLRRVEISPLGVRTRQQPPRSGVWRAVVAVVAVGLASVLARLAGAAPSMLVAGAMLLVMFALPMLALNLAGPWVVGRLAARDARRSRTAVQLLAARSMLENPQQVWRQVSALGLSSFVAVFLGVGMAIATPASQRQEDVVLLLDLRTGVLLTLAITFITVACSAGINQSAAVLDRRQLYVGLDMVGMPASLIDAARRRAVLRPLLATVVLSSVAALALVVPLGAASRMVDGASLATVAGVLVGGLLLVRLALLTSRGALRQLLRDGLARTE